MRCLFNDALCEMRESKSTNFLNRAHLSEIIPARVSGRILVRTDASVTGRAHAVNAAEISMRKGMDRRTINQYFVPATCTSGCKPEEARRPGSVFKDPYPLENTSGGATPRWRNTRSVELSAAGAESSGLSPESSAVGRFAR